MKNSDKIRAALIATAQSIFPVLNLFGVIDLTSDEISIVMLSITNAVTLIFLVVGPENDSEPAPPEPRQAQMRRPAERPSWPTERRSDRE